MGVISASYKTDIPAFYGEWFERRLHDEFVKIRNPFNGKFSTVSLKPSDIDGFVFWTRNIAPFRPRLEKLIVGQYPFYIQFTLTGYPRILENSVPAPHVALQQIHDIRARYGPLSIVWRYDPILISSITPIQFHLANFKKLSTALKGATSEVVVSFTQFYNKTSRNLARLEKEFGVSVEQPSRHTQDWLLLKLSTIAAINGQKLTVCSQPHLESETVAAAACISGDRLGLRHPIKIQGNRDGCLCVAARDMGAYDTCPQGCVYCYAVSQTEKAKTSLKAYEVTASSL